MLALDASIFQTAADEVVLDPDVLAPLMEDWILGQGKGRLAVHLQLHHLDVPAEELC
jgi:hypothetical protein